ncbi:hypothetical protein [Clavibacter tessellarius]|uniref:hypothetical protein n=1 Tax=Clavibacter tessellarius TaxID=31965 RepID=UPI00324D96DF
MSGTPITFAPERTSTAMLAASHTAAAREAQRVAFHCAKLASPGCFRWPGSANAATTSSPMVTEAAASWMTRATGRP